MQSEPEISIIIINYNTFALTCNCIRSVINYTKDVNYELILVDNHSTEGNPQEFSTLFPSIRLIVAEKNTGFAAGNNLGISHARGKFILLLNSDTELRENSVRVCLEELKARKDTGVVTCNLVYPDGKIQAQCQHFPSVATEFLEATRLFKLLPARLREKTMQGIYFSYKQKFEPDWVWGTFFFFKKEILESFPGRKLSERFFMYCEDLEWCFLLRRRGWKIVFIPGTAVVHLVSGSGTGERAEKLRRIAAHEKIFIQTYLGEASWYFIRLLRLFNYSLTKRKKPGHALMYRIYKDI
jgi:GT2 family glycosyltransferase